MKYESKSVRISRSWIVLGALYAAFFSWYTSFAGPLSEDEIEHYTALLISNGEGVNRDRWIDFMKSDTGDSFAMWNAVDLLETPQRIEGVDPEETTQQVIERYARPFFTLAIAHASHPVLSGSSAAPALDIWGIEGGDEWDQGVLVRYRSRRDVMEIMEEMLSSDSGIHSFKVAAVEKTIAFPLDPWFHPGDPRLLLALLFVIVGLVFQLRLAWKAG